MGVHNHVREMKHTERTLVFPSPPVQTLSGECFSTMIFWCRLGERLVKGGRHLFPPAKLTFSSQ